MNIKELPIEQRYGFLVWNQNESPIARDIKTDERFEQWEWFPWSGVESPHSIYRRPVDVELGYVLVALDELFKAGDEVLCGGEWMSSDWHNDFYSAMTPRKALDIRGVRFDAVRRKVVTADKDGWFLAGEIKPKEGPVWVVPVSGVKTPVLFLEYKDIHGFQYSHWQPAILPNPPKSDEEIEFDKAWESFGTDSVVTFSKEGARDFFLSLIKSVRESVIKKGGDVK